MIKEYIQTVISASALGGLISIMLPEGEGLKRVLTLIMSLFMLCTVARPLISLVEYLKNADFKDIAEKYTSAEIDYEDLWQSTFEKMTKEETDKYIESYLAEKLNTYKDSFDADCSFIFSEKGASFDVIEIDLKSAVNPYAVERLIEDSFQCECRVNENWG